MIGGVGVDATKKFGRSFLLVATNADANNVAVPVARREVKDFLCFFDSEVTGGIEDPQQRYAEIARAAGASAIQTFKDCVEILFAIEADAHRNIDLRV